MLYLCKFGYNQPTSLWDILHNRKQQAKADSDTNTEADQIHTKNNMSSSPLVGGHSKPTHLNLGLIIHVYKISKDVS